MGADRHEGGRRGGAKIGMKRQYNGPPKEGGWCWFTLDMMTSAVFRSLSKNAMKVLMRIAVEHMSHAGTSNGKLIVTHKQFSEYGIRLASVADAIREAEFLGFIKVNRGLAFKGSHEANVYTLTWLGNHRDYPPTNEWKGYTPQHVRAWKKMCAAKAQSTATKRKNRPSRPRTGGAQIVPLHG